jgi:CRISPR-associated protein Cas1
VTSPPRWASRARNQPAAFTSPTPRDVFLVAYQAAKALEVRHEFLDQTIAWSRVPHVQALLLARALHGDIDAYPPVSGR